MKNSQLKFQEAPGTRLSNGIKSTNVKMVSYVLQVAKLSFFMFIALARWGLSRKKIN